MNENLQQLAIEAYNRYKVIHIEAAYSGGGDSGNINEVTAETEGKALVELDEALQDKIRDECCELLEAHHGGWEINDGSYGKIIIDILGGTITLDHNNYTEEYSSNTKEIKLEDYLPKKQLTDFWDFFSTDYIGISRLEVSFHVYEKLTDLQHSERPYDEWQLPEYKKTLKHPSNSLVLEVLNSIIEDVEEEAEITDHNITICPSEKTIKLETTTVDRGEEPDETAFEAPAFHEIVKKKRTTIQKVNTSKVESNIKLI